MKERSFFKFLLVILALPMMARADELATYFTEAHKKKVIADLQTTLSPACAGPVAIEKAMMDSKIVWEYSFFKAFAENPKIKEAFYDDLETISSDPSCQQAESECRSKIVATSFYYLQKLRPDVPGCQEYTARPPMSRGYDNYCDNELKFRNETLQTTSRLNGTRDSKGIYTNKLVDQLQKSLQKAFINFCGNASRTSFTIPLPKDVYKSNVTQAEFNMYPNKSAGSCVEKKLTLLSEVIPLEYNKSSTTVGIDEVKPVQAKIEEFIASDKDLIITDITVTANSAKTPYLSRSGKKMALDPKSNEKGFALAQDRAIFVSKMLNEIKKSRPSLSSVIFKSNALSAGPEFELLDLNTRMVTSMTPDYKKRVTSLFEQNKEMYAAQGYVKSADELLDQSKYKTLYDVKFKPFQGFRIEISGFHKKKLKCSESSSKSKAGSSSATKSE